MASQLCYDPQSREFELVMVDALTIYIQAKIADADLRLDRFLLDYFRKVKLGEHVFQRNYEFISGSDHNKRMFISLFWKTYHHLAFTGEPLTEGDFYNLLLFLCPDLPRSLVHAAFMTIQLPVHDKLLLSDFIYSFQLCFYFVNFISLFRETLKFTERIMTKERVIETALDVHSVISNESVQGTMNALPPFNSVRNAFINVEIFENWKSVQDCLVRSDGMNNAVGILPLRSTMTDSDSLRSVIPSDWGRRHSIQPTLLTLASHSSSVPTFDSSQSERGIIKLASTLSNGSKLLRRPSRQIKLTAQATQSSIQSDIDASMPLEPSSATDNSSTNGSSSYTGSTSSSQQQRSFLRGGTRARLPSIASNGSTGNGTSKMHFSNSVPTNLSSQVLEEQDSSDDASSMSSDADNN